MMKAAICSLAAILMLAAAASAQTPTDAPKPPAHKSAATTSSAARGYDRALLHPALLKAQGPAKYEVKFVTTEGDFTVTVTRAWAPLGADRFYNLVKHHYFDGARPFRVLPGFVAQFGISAYPPVTKAWREAKIKDDPHSQSN